MIAPLYVTVECVSGEHLHAATVNCLEYIPMRNGRGYYLASGKEGRKDLGITQESYHRVLAALTHANAKYYGIETAEFVVPEF